MLRTFQPLAVTLRPESGGLLDLNQPARHGRLAPRTMQISKLRQPCDRSCGSRATERSPTVAATSCAEIVLPTLKTNVVVNAPPPVCEGAAAPRADGSVVWLNPMGRLFEDCGNPAAKCAAWRQESCPGPGIGAMLYQAPCRAGTSDKWLTESRLTSSIALHKHGFSSRQSCVAGAWALPVGRDQGYRRGIHGTGGRQARQAA